MNERYEELVGSGEEDIDLAAAALAFARDEYPGLDGAVYLARLDELAAGVRSRLAADSDVPTTVAAINHHLFVDQEFRGNLEDYSDPRNSFLNEVLDRRLGIPISLAVVYLEVGWRLGLPLQGVSFPGHFLVRCPHADGVIVLDPFFNGISLDSEQLLDRARRALGGEHDLDRYLPHFVAGVGKKVILARMLRNLKTIFFDREQPDRALVAANRVLLATPDEAQDVRDRGRILESLDCHGPALSDYRRYLELAPNSGDAGDIHERIQALDRVPVKLH